MKTKKVRVKPRKKTSTPRTKDRSLGTQRIEGLTELRDVLAPGDSLEQHFTAHKVKTRLVPSVYGPEDIRRVREQLRASQGIFADFLGVTPWTVSAWELGRRKASRTICRYLDDIQEFPELWAKRMQVKPTS